MSGQLIEVPTSPSASGGFGLIQGTYLGNQSGFLIGVSYSTTLRVTYLTWLMQVTTGLQLGLWVLTSLLQMVLGGLLYLLYTVTVSLSKLLGNTIRLLQVALHLIIKVWYLLVGIGRAVKRAFQLLGKKPLKLLHKQLPKRSRGRPRKNKPESWWVRLLRRVYAELHKLMTGPVGRPLTKVTALTHILPALWSVFFQLVFGRVGLLPALGKSLYQAPQALQLLALRGVIHLVKGLLPKRSRGRPRKDQPEHLLIRYTRSWLKWLESAASAAQRRLKS